MQFNYHNSYNIREARALSSVDVPHRFVASAIYELPFGRSMNRWLDTVAGGWQLNGIVTIQTGGILAVVGHKCVQSAGAVHA